jgi:hypothetical protein
VYIIKSLAKETFLGSTITGPVEAKLSVIEGKNAAAMKDRKGELCREYVVEKRAPLVGCQARSSAFGTGTWQGISDHRLEEI